MEIRPARVADADAIQEIGHRTWPPTYAFAGEDYVADGLARWWSPSSGIGSALLAALLDEVPAGTASVRLEYVDGNDDAAQFYARKGFTELRREPGERPGWPDVAWVERRL